MKILYFGIFERPYDTEVYIAKTLEKMGHEVNRCFIVKYTAKEALKLVEETPHDFILFSKGWLANSVDEHRIFIDRVKSLKIGWFFDLVWGTPHEHLIWSHPVFGADLVFTTDGGHQKKFKNAGINHACLRQGIYEPEAVLGESMDKYKRDIIFLGTNSHPFWAHRENILRWLEKTYKDRFEWVGKYDGVRNMKLNNVLASVKVVVGDSVVSPYYWSNRLYEVIGRGGFLLFPYVEGIEKEFIPYKHFIPYTPGRWEELKEKIDYYVSHDDERNKIRLAGFEHCKKNHTYRHRCEKFIKKVNEYSSPRSKLVC
jgi:hypothetical protein